MTLEWEQAPQTWVFIAAAQVQWQLMFLSSHISAQHIPLFQLALNNAEMFLNFSISYWLHTMCGGGGGKCTMKV